MKLELKAKDLIAGKYRVVKKLGEGGCGSVYRCQLSDAPERLVAVKVLESANDLPRFERERRLLKKIDSDHVVGFIAQGTHDRFPYLVLEHMDGGSLRDLLDQRKTLSVEEAAWVGLMTVWGLMDAGTVHRDLKPENLLLTKSPDGRVALLPGSIKRASIIKVADFGLAKSHDPKTMQLTNTGHIMGTPLYMSPEQCRSTKKVDHRTDMYSLGVMLFEMVTGKTPFDADDPYSLMKLHCEQRPDLRSIRHDGLHRLVARLLAKEPEDRFETLEELADKLEHLAGISRRGAKRGAGLSPAARWILVGAGMIIFIALSWMLRDRVVGMVKDWLSPTPPPPYKPVKPAL